MPGISCVMLVAFLPVSCKPMDTQGLPVRAGYSGSDFEGDYVTKSFVGNVKALKESRGYRQNCWMKPRGGTDKSLSAALCLDLRDQVYLVVFSDDSNRSLERLPERMRNLVETPSRLRSSMDPDAFILNERNLPIAGIMHVPDDCTESCGTDFINSLLDRNYQPEDFGFQND